MPNAWKTRQRLPVAISQAKRSDAPFSRPVDIPPEVRSSGPSEFQGDKGRISKNIDPRQHFVNAVRTVILMKSAARSMNQRRDSALGTRFTGESGTSPGLFSDPWVAALRKARETALFEKLKALEPIQGLSAHQALVRQVQFSPNGKYMATSSRDRTAVIFHVGDTFSTHRILVHVRGLILQLAWSPNGKILLTRLPREIKVWTEDGVCKKTINRLKLIQSVVWLPDGSGILSVEGTNLVKLDLHGNVLDTYSLAHIQLNDAAITPDCTRLVGVGFAIPPKDGPQPRRHTRVEKRIVIYNMLTERVESQTPFFDDVRHVAVAKQGSAVLTSFAKAAPQLWILEIMGGRDRGVVTSRLNLAHTFAFAGKVPEATAGPCQFGGKDHQFVICAGIAGGVHIWDRQTAALLHFIRPRSRLGAEDLTCIGWNDAVDDPVTFATGGSDGTVRIWSVSSRDSESPQGKHAEGDPSRRVAFSLPAG